MKRRFKPYISDKTLSEEDLGQDFATAREVADTRVGKKGIYLRAGFDFLPHPYIRLQDVASADAGSYVTSGCG